MKAPPEGGAHVTKVPGMISAARHAVSCSGVNTAWPSPGSWTVHTACQESHLFDSLQSLPEIPAGKSAYM